MTCEGSASATVQITFADGSVIKVLSNHPGVNVTITPAVASGNITVYATGQAYAAGCILIPSLTEVYGSVPAGTSVTLYETDNNSCPNGAYYGISPGTSGSGTVWVKGTVSLSEIGTDNGYTITVTDTTGTIYTKTVTGSPPTYQISCDQDCPAGQCKCHSDSYPGYCCQDCRNTAAQIQSITNQLRDKINASQLPTSIV